METLATWAILGVCLWVLLLAVAALDSQERQRDRLDRTLGLGCGLALIIIPLCEVLFGAFYLAYKLIGGAQ